MIRDWVKTTKILSICVLAMVFILTSTSVFSQDNEAGSIDVLTLPFVNVRNDSNLQYLSSAFKVSINTKLGTADVFNVVEYSDYEDAILGSDIEEDDFNDRQILDQISQIASSRYLIYGSFENDGENIEVSTAIFDATNNSIVFNLEQTIEDDLQIFDVIDTIGTVLLLKFSVFIEQSDYYQFNFRPSFFWLEAPLAEKYELYIDDRIAYNGLNTSFTIRRPLAAGEHTFKTITYIGGEILESEVFTFTLLELDNPELTEFPQQITYNEYPLFTFDEAEGAIGYRIYINDELAYEGTEKTFQVEERMDFGTYTFVAEYYNPFQNKRTETTQFEIKELFASDLIFPINGERLYSDTNANINFQYENECDVAEYELFLDDQSKGQTEEKSFVYRDMEEEGEYSWYVITRAGSQEVRSETQSFEYVHPYFKFGFLTNSTIGISSTIDMTLSTAYSGILTIEWLPLKFLGVELGLGMGYSKLNINGLSYSYDTDNLDLEYSFLSLSLAAKYKISYEILSFLGVDDPFHFAFPLGFIFDFPLSSGISMDSNQYDFSGLSNAHVSMLAGTEISYVFNDYSEILLGIYYNLGLTSLTASTQFDEGLEHRINIAVGINFYKLALYDITSLFD